MSFTISTLKRCSVRLYPQLFVVWLMSYLCFLWLFVNGGVQCVLNIWITRGCLIRGRNCLHFAGIEVHSRLLEGSVLLIFSDFCVVFFFFCLSSSRVLSIQILSVSLDCPFLISPSVFSNVYIITHLMYAYLTMSSFYMNRIDGILVDVLAASAVLDHRFESRSVQTKVF
jgi:hypothetical protein